MGVALAIALLAFLLAHVGIAGTLAARSAWVRAALALLVPPLAPWWAWNPRVRARPLAIAWLASFAAYTALLIVSSYR